MQHFNYKSIAERLIDEIKDFNRRINIYTDGPLRVMRINKDIEDHIRSLPENRLSEAVTALEAADLQFRHNGSDDRLLWQDVELCSKALGLLDTSIAPGRDASGNGELSQQFQPQDNFWRNWAPSAG